MTAAREDQFVANGIKAALKPFVPDAVLRAWKRHKFDLEQKRVAGKPLDQVFADIYESGDWAKAEGVKYHSGPGSLPEITKGYENFVAATLNADPSIHTLVDIGCGDFQVSSRILKRLERPVRYVGCDIAANVIAYNSERHGVPGRIEFRVVNVAAEPPPHGDIVTIREVFQHLSNDTILAALANLRKTFRRAIITEGLPLKPSQPNLDIQSGYRTRDGLNSGVYLELAPFNLKVLDRYEFHARENEILRTLVVEL